jgi:eukaryotic-like serine/threonine-protein kinase
MSGRRAPWWVFACIVPFLAYFALLVYCDVRRPEAEGLTFAFAGQLRVKTVDPRSAADRAGLRSGDEIVGVNGTAFRQGQTTWEAKLDWETVTLNARIGEPIALDVRRDGAPLRVALVLQRERWARWASREGIDLAVVRLVQFVTLAVGILVLYRRPFDPVARVGAWLLGAVGVFCVTLPYRFAAVWHGIWLPAGVLLWIAHLSSLCVGALLFTFFLLFPVRRIDRTPRLAALWLPMLGALPFIRYRALTVYRPSAAFDVRDGFAILVAVSMVYMVATVACAVWSYRHLQDATEKRRLRVLLAGGGFGCVLGSAVFVGWWFSDSASLFRARAMGWLFPLLVIVPVSFAYAILRHRLFDVRLIVRRGVQYALARRLLLSLVPALLLGMVIDLYVHRDEPMKDVVAARALVYLVLSALAVLAQFQRQRWMEALDRRFFRERYDAQRILRQVADDSRDAGSLERVAGRIVAQIALAVHPRFVVLMHRAAGADAFRPLAAEPPGTGPERLSAGGKLIALARLLARPVEVSARETAWLSGQLPGEEVAAVREAAVELVVPIGTDPQGPDALLVLGERRSEEPYAREDQDLFQAIAGNLALLLSRDSASGPGGASFRECPACGTCYDEAEGKCATDGTGLAVVRLPRVLVARYRVDSRLGHGGMGTVYVASDLALHREVALKVLREDLAADRDAVERFEREARTAAGLSHPNVVTIHDFGVTAGGRAFLVMERLQGRTLREEMERCGAMPPHRVIALLRGVCAAVDAAHRRHLVHRDLKPENVFLAEVEDALIPKVLDFGIAKATLGAPRRGTRHTATGVLLGTPEYMAPEQLRGEDVNPSWDLWALGVLAHELLTGVHPFSSIVVGRTDHGGDATVSWRPSVAADERWTSFFQEALAVDPAARPPSAAAFFARLERNLS